MIKKIIVPVFFLLLFIFAVQPARAAWSDPQKLSTSSNTEIMPSITTDAIGYLHAVWMELTPGDEDFWTDRENPGIYYSKWNGDTWSTPLKISQNTGKWAGLPAIAADSQNRLHVVWDEATDDKNGQIMYSMYDGASWSLPVTISTATNGSNKANWSARISVDLSDIVHVIYNFADYNLRPWANEYYYTRKNGTWSTAVKISDDCTNCQHASLAVGPGSTVTVALWGGFPAGNGIWIKRNTGSGWGTPAILVSGGEDAQYPKLVIDGTNRLHLVWAQNASWLGIFNVRYSTSTDGISWSSPISINNTNISWTWWGLPLVGLTKDSKNNVYAGWGEPNAVSGVDIKYRKWNGTTWEAPVILRNVTEVDSPYLFQDVWDNQHFVWTEKNQISGQWEIWYSILPGFWANIGSGGGSLTVSAYERTYVDLTIPSGALSANKNISVAIGPLPASANPAYVNIPRSYYFGPSGQTFAKAVTTVYYYLDAEVTGGDPRDLGIYVWNGQTNAWNYQTGTVNTSQKTVTIKPTHFSLFGMMAPRVNTIFLPPLQKESFQIASGRTIPVKFQLTYATDNSPVLPPDIELVVKDKDDKEVALYIMDNGDEGIRYDKGNNQYIVNLQTGKLVMGEGNYKLIVRIAGVEVGSKEITVK